MKELTKQQILFAFDDLRNGLKQLHMNAVEHNDKIAEVCARVHYNIANKKVGQLGGEMFDLPELEDFMQ